MKMGNTGVPSYIQMYDMYMNLCEVRCLMYRSLLLGCLCAALRVLLKFKTSVGCNCPDCDQDSTQMRTDTHSHKIRTHTKTPFVAATKDICLKMWLLLHHGCHRVQSTEDGLINTQQQTAQDKKKLKFNLSLCS